MPRARLSPLPEDDLQQLLVGLIGHSEVIGRDASGRTILQIPVDDHTLARLLVFGTRAAAMGHSWEPTEARRPHEAEQVASPVLTPTEADRRSRIRDELSRSLVLV